MDFNTAVGSGAMYREHWFIRLHNDEI